MARNQCHSTRRDATTRWLTWDSEPVIIPRVTATSREGDRVMDRVRRLIYYSPRPPLLVLLSQRNPSPQSPRLVSKIWEDLDINAYAVRTFCSRAKQTHNRSNPRRSKSNFQREHTILSDRDHSVNQAHFSRYEVLLVYYAA